MLPIGDDNRARRTRPVVVPILVAANVIVWFAQLASGEAFTGGWSAVPYEITTGLDLVGVDVIELAGERHRNALYPGPSPVALTLLSSMFMHGSWGHLLGNLLYLVVFGDQIEDLLGRVRFLAFYLACGVCAALAQVAWDPTSTIPCLGASGAIAGVLGAYLVRFPTNTVQVLLIVAIVGLPAWLVLGFWIVLQVLSQSGSHAGQAAGVAYLAHIGGFAAGLLLIQGAKRPADPAASRDHSR